MPPKQQLSKAAKAAAALAGGKKSKKKWSKKSMKDRAQHAVFRPREVRQNLEGSSNLQIRFCLCFGRQIKDWWFFS